MIEIKSVDGSVLYTAANATDVRSAVEEAVRAGADLTRADLTRADLTDANLTRANLTRAYLTDANLTDANLTDANLTRANLTDANLTDANLTRAYLTDANLTRANLTRAKGINPYLTTPLHILADQPGKIRAYKLVDAKGRSPIQTRKLLYEKGSTVEVADASTDPNVHCAKGINVASLDWCLREWRPGYRILLVEFTARDIAAIPTGSDGKFRLRRCKVVGEKDLVELGVVAAEAAS